MSKQKSAPQKSSDSSQQAQDQHPEKTPVQNVAKPEPIAKKEPAAKPVEPLIIWVAGGKGGVGKTTMSRLLTDLLLEKTDYIYGYDCDPINPQFKRFYGAEFLPLTSPDQKTADIAVETLAEKIEAKTHDYIIIDSPAGEVDMLGQLEERFAFISNLSKMGARLTRAFVMSTTPESVNLLQRSLDDTRGLPVGHVAVRNLHFGGPHYFDAYNDSKTKTQLEGRGGLTVDFPELGAIASSSIDQKSLTYSEAIEKESGLPTMRRSMVYQWRENVRKEFAKAGHLLGVEG